MQHLRMASFSKGLLSFAATWFCLMAETRATDWPQYRGANHNGISADRIKQNWAEEAPVPLWRVPCTNGFSSLAVSGGKVFTQVRRNNGSADQETCVALDAQTGKEVWATPIGVAVYESGVGSPDDGPRSTPSVANGRVFVLSSYLALHCLDAANGALIWSKDLSALYPADGLNWQNSASPLIDGDLIFVNCNTASQSLLALRTSDGSLAWRTQSAALTHSTPVAAEIFGTAQIVFAARDKLISIDRENGALLWSVPYPFNYDTSLAGSPVVYSNLVCISANYSMGAYAARISYADGAFSASPAWTNRSLKAHWMTPVAHQGYLYGMFGSSSTSPFKCIDIETGTEQWSVSGFGRGGTVVVDGRLLALSERGDLVLVEANPAAYTELGRFKVFPDYDAYTNKCWNVPAICDGRIYARSTAEAVCLDVSIPALKMMTPEILADNRLRLRVGTENGAALEPARCARIEMLWITDNPAAGPATWQRITDGFSIVDGQLVLEVPASAQAGFYAASETTP